MRNFVIAAGFYLGAFIMLPAMAKSPSNDGQYYELKRSYECRRDLKQYGRFHNYGYWQGGRWCGRNMPGGYYVYKDGTWYIWSAQRNPSDGPATPGQSDTVRSADQSDSAAQVGER